MVDQMLLKNSRGGFKDPLGSRKSKNNKSPSKIRNLVSRTIYNLRQGIYELFPCYSFP